MKAYLLLEDGTRFEGSAIGEVGVAIGETVFNTGMTGYQEVLTDPSYYGQMVAMTYPLIGNYGVNQIDPESGRSWVRGYIVRELDRAPSNFRCEGGLEDFLKRERIVGIEGIDTRRLTRILRSSGTMNGAILPESELPNQETILRRMKEYRIERSVESVTVPAPEEYRAENGRRKVALLDFGYKRNILRSLLRRDCDVTVLPAGTPPQEILAGGYDGIMLSNGPGDPADNVQIIQNLRQLLHSGTPVFGICLGHQLTALAMGARTEKLKYGHRGANHPVKDRKLDRTYITSQNHGYAVVADTVDPGIAEVSHVNMNDGTVEGVEYRNLPVFTVQFHPEASPGPQDTAYLFDRFVELMDRHA